MARPRSGTLDPSFGRRGQSSIADFGGGELLRDIAVGPDGFIAVAGTRYISRGRNAPTSVDVAVARYTPNGFFDLRFSKDGKDVLATASAEDAHSVAATPDGGMVVAGTTRSVIDDPHGRITLWRWRRNGAKDAQFGVVTPIASLPKATAQTVAGVVALGDGSVIVGGTIFRELDIPLTGAPVVEEVAPDARCQAQFVLARVDATGALDPRFGVGGIATSAPSGACDVMHAMTRQRDGKIVAVGRRAFNGRSGVLVARLGDNGLPDLTFGAGGLMTPVTPSGYEAGRAVAVAPDGAIVVAGTRANQTWLSLSDQMMVWRYTALGTADSGFGSSGVARAPYTGRVAGVAVQRNGRIVVAGELGGCFLIFCTWDPITFGMSRTGAIDRGFGSSGRVAFPSRLMDANALELQGDRPVVGANHSPLCLFPCFFFFFTDRGPYNLALIRLQP